MRKSYRKHDCDSVRNPHVGLPKISIMSIFPWHLQSWKELEKDHAFDTNTHVWTCTVVDGHVSDTKTQLWTGSSRVVCHFTDTHTQFWIGSSRVHEHVLYTHT